MPTPEALDLIATLPDGSRYVAAMFPTRAWSEMRSLTADICDAISWLTWATAMDHDKVSEPPRIMRPADRAIQTMVRERHRSAREKLENARREEV